MRLKEAFLILELPPSIGKTYTMSEVKKQYHQLALKYHPDKNGNGEDFTKKLQQINEAYHTIQTHLNEGHTHDPKSSCLPLYVQLLKEFLQHTLHIQRVEPIVDILHKILFQSRQIAVQLFSELDREMTLNIYRLLSKYRTIFHFGNDFLETIREIVLKKYENVEVYKLNPSVNDLLNCHLYKLCLHGHNYIVPLWHDEIYFESSSSSSTPSSPLSSPSNAKDKKDSLHSCCSDLIVLCEPEFPDHVYMDEERRLVVERRIDVDEELPRMLANQLDVDIVIGEKKWTIPLNALRLQTYQTYVLSKCGVPVIKDDLYDVSERGDILVHITISPSLDG